MKKRGLAIQWETIIPWIIALAVIAIGVIAVVALRGSGEGVFAKIYCKIRGIC